MATTKFYLDTRAVSAGEPAPLKIAVTKHGKTALYSLDVKLQPSQWDNHRQVILNHPNKLRLNNFIMNRKTVFDNYLMELTNAGELALMSATQIKNRIAGLINPDDAPERADLFIPRYLAFAETRNAERTREIYLETHKKILRFDSKAKRLSFEDITKSWLDRFEHYLSSEEHLAPNTIAIHLRNIRAVVNEAIDDEVTGTYAFRKKKIKYQTTPKRSFTLERLQELWNYPCEPFQRRGYLQADLEEHRRRTAGIHTLEDRTLLQYQARARGRRDTGAVQGQGTALRPCRGLQEIQVVRQLPRPRTEGHRACHPSP